MRQRGKCKLSARQKRSHSTYRRPAGGDITLVVPENPLRFPNAGQPKRRVRRKANPAPAKKQDALEELASKVAPIPEQRETFRQAIARRWRSIFGRR